MVSTQKNATDWLSKSNNSKYFPSVPTLSEKFGRGTRRVQTVILVQQDRTAHLEREYVQVIGAGIIATFAGGPWGHGCR